MKHMPDDLARCAAILPIVPAVQGTLMEMDWNRRIQDAADFASADAI